MPSAAPVALAEGCAIHNAKVAAVKPITATSKRANGAGSRPGFSRASLGHTGKALVSSAATQAIYAAVVIAALARICASLQPDWSEPLLQISVLGWVIAYFGFAAVYGPLLVRAKR